MEKITRKRLSIFGSLTLVFLAIMSVLYYQTHNNDILTALMFTPAISVILTRLITQEGTEELFLKPNFKGNLKWYLIAWILTPFIAYIGAVLYFCIFPGDFSLLHSSYAMAAGITSTQEYIVVLLQTLPLAILINPVMGLAQCFGEEFAWRGYLLPKLNSRFSPVTATILTGTIWGIWHAPIIAMGYNYGIQHPFLGIAAMTVLCIIIGIIAGFLFFRTNSVWPAVLFHAAFNGIDLYKASDLFMAKEANAFIGPDVTGIIGGVGFILAAWLCLAAMRRTTQ